MREDTTIPFRNPALRDGLSEPPRAGRRVRAAKRPSQKTLGFCLAFP